MLKILKITFKKTINVLFNIYIVLKSREKSNITIGNNCTYETDFYTMKYYWAVKKFKKILSFVTGWMDLENILLSEIS